MLILGIGVAAAAGPVKDESRGFDHHLHEARIAVSGKPELSCTRCHALSTSGFLRGRPGHAACFGGACHGPSPTRRAPAIGDRTALCEACHAPAAIAALGRRRTGRIKPAPAPPDGVDFGIHMSHAAHAKVATSGRGCVTCHADPAAAKRRRPPRAHSRCAGCHAGTGRAPTTPPMTRCKVCHLPALGAAFAPKLAAAGALAVTFSHAAHRGRIRRKAGRCRICHVAADRATGGDLPYPQKRACTRCHDGRRAFSVTAPQCRRCHATAPGVAASFPAPAARFSHRAHRDRGMNVPCSQCHRLDGAGRPVATATHAACAGANCHESDFSTRAPKICGVCHESAEPWRPLHGERRRWPETELGSQFSHAQHRVGPATDCTACHAVDGHPGRGVAAGHRACDGGRCHGGTAQPPMTACKGCHALGLLADRARRDAARTWSVRERFSHRAHRVDARTAKPVACTACHRRIGEAKNLASVPTPRKATCAPCHDGVTAFKLTGQGCPRCHAP